VTPPRRVPCSTPGCWRLTPVNASCSGCDRNLCGWCDRVGAGRCFACRARLASQGDPMDASDPKDGAA
jgi:hypothetical protein